MATQKQINANRENAKLSTGPRSAEGKQIVSGNRILHGVLSNKLLLDNESPLEYRILMDGLLSELKPVGTLEQTLVEKIALIIWRQKRLVTAETATITLASNDKQIARTVSSGLGLSSYGEDSLEMEDLQPPDQEQLDWCQAVVNEFNAADILDLGNLPQKTPLIYKQLASDADSEGESIEEHLSEIGLEEYLSDLLRWCYKELYTLEKKVDQYPAIAAMSQTAKDELSIPWGKLDVFNKYQATLDNQLYKAMKALQDAQEWRFKTITTDAVEVNYDPAEAV